MRSEKASLSSSGVSYRIRRACRNDWCREKTTHSEGSLLVLKCSMVERLSYQSADCGSVWAAEASDER